MDVDVSYTALKLFIFIMSVLFLAGIELTVVLKLVIYCVILSSVSQLGLIS